MTIKSVRHRCSKIRSSSFRRPAVAVAGGLGGGCLKDHIEVVPRTTGGVQAASRAESRLTENPHPNDEPASILLERIRAERVAAPTARRRGSA
jgi:hypothetical protein